MYVSASDAQPPTANSNLEDPKVEELESPAKVIIKTAGKQFRLMTSRLHTPFSLESAAKIDPGFFQHILLSPIQNAGRRCVRRQITLASPCAK